MSARRARGLTLLELMVGLGVSLVTIAAATTLLVQQQHAYASTSADRAQQEAGRVALQEIVARLKIAAYGVDPNLALDFGATTRAPRADLRAPATMVQVPSHECAAPVRCRDRTDGSDEIVFLARNPWFRRVASGVTSSTLTLVGQLKAPLYPGQLLLVSCLGGNRVRAYVTVDRYVAASAEPDPAATVDVQLRDGQTAGGLDVFGRENGQLADACFSIARTGEQPVVTAVDRFRFYVAWYDPDGGVVEPQTDGARPYLMLDQGLRRANGSAIRLPVAPDVEDVQFSYLFRPATAGGPPQLVGAEPGVNAAAQAPLAIAVGDTVPPAMSDAPDAAARLTGHPANVQAVRVSLVVRQAERDLGVADAQVPAAANRAARDGQPHYRRSLWETTVLLRNMASAFFAFPI